MRKCKCGNEISEERLLAQPTTRLCISCRKDNDETPTTGYMSWEHKTAPTIVTSAEVGEAGIRYLRSHSRRGVHAQLPLGSAKNPWLAASVRTTEGRAKFDGIRTEESPDSSLEGASNFVAATCHPERPSVGPSRLCVECSIEWYRKRLK